jgi:hypothetical protein
MLQRKPRGTYLRDKFYRLKARRGYQRAIVAVAHKILVAIYHTFPSKSATTNWAIFTSISSTGIP